jgi:hypothetical protein
LKKQNTPLASPRSTSTMTMTDIKTIIEPTFRTQPDEAGKLYYQSKAQVIADEILRDKLEGKSNDIEFEFEELSKMIADEVKVRIAPIR